MLDGLQNTLDGLGLTDFLVLVGIVLGLIVVLGVFCICLLARR